MCRHAALTTSATPQLLDLQCPGAAPQKLSQTLDQTSPTLPSLHQHCIRWCLLLIQAAPYLHI